MKRAINSNNQGVVLLQRGELKKSMRILRDALQAANAHLQSKEFCDDNNDLNPSPGFSSNFASSSTSYVTNNAFHAKKFHYLFLRPEIGPPETGNLLLYTQGISLCEASDCSEVSSTEAVMICSTIFFNLGLIYHLRGLQSDASKFLPNAESLYRKSLSLLAEVEVDRGPTVKLLLDFLPMAIFNNMAHLSHEACNFQQCKLYLEELKEVVFRITPATYEDVEISNLVANTQIFFYLNMVVLNEAKPAAAA